MNYDTYIYLWPPRPETKIPRGMLSFYEQRGWIAQKKKNGTCTVIFTNGSQVIFKTRHYDEDHKMWQAKPEHINFFLQHGGKNGTWNVFVAELLHNKTTHIKDHLYIFDQIVADGVQLVKMTFMERQLLLRQLGGTFTDDCYMISPFISISHCFTSGFVKMFDTLKPEDEGLVLKDPNARLKPCYRGNSNASWQVKSRLPHKNYSY